MSRSSRANLNSAATLSTFPVVDRDVVMGPPPLPPQLTMSTSIGGGSDDKDDASVVDKYRRLKRKFYELEEKHKEILTELHGSGERAAKWRNERTALLDRILELDGALAGQHQHQRTILPLPLSTAYPHSLLNPLAQKRFSSNLDRAIAEAEQEDSSADPLMSSRHVGPNARKRMEAELKERLEEEAREARRNARRPRGKGKEKEKEKEKERERERERVEKENAKEREKELARVAEDQAKAERERRENARLGRERMEMEMERDGAGPPLTLAPAPGSLHHNAPSVPQFLPRQHERASSPPRSPRQAMRSPPHSQVIVSSSGTRLRLKPPAPPSSLHPIEPHPRQQTFQGHAIEPASVSRQRNLSRPDPSPSKGRGRGPRRSESPYSSPIHPDDEYVSVVSGNTRARRDSVGMPHASQHGGVSDMPSHATLSPTLQYRQASADPSKVTQLQMQMTLRPSPTIPHAHPLAPAPSPSHQERQPLSQSHSSPILPLAHQHTHTPSHPTNLSNPDRSMNMNGSPRLNHNHPSNSMQSSAQSSGASRTKPKRLKAHTVTSRSFSIPVVPRDKKGRPILPLNVGIMTVINLGDVCMREHFHTERYIFPVGYEVTRRYLSTTDPIADVVYHCTILDGGDGPKFQIVAADQPDKPIIAGTATGAWSVVVRAANHVRNRQHSNSVSGPDFFGLGQNTIKHLIQELPGADRLKDYVWQHFVEGGHLFVHENHRPLGGRHAAVIPALPDDHDEDDSVDISNPSGNDVAMPNASSSQSFYDDEPRELQIIQVDPPENGNGNTAMKPLQFHQEYPGDRERERERETRRGRRTSVHQYEEYPDERIPSQHASHSRHAHSHPYSHPHSQSPTMSPRTSSRSPIMHRERETFSPHSHHRSPYDTPALPAEVPPVPAPFASIMNAYPTAPMSHSPDPVSPYESMPPPVNGARSRRGIGNGTDR